MIWKNKLTIETLNNRQIPGLTGTIGIQYTAIGDDYIIATMPVDERTIQPMGLLHGGASAALAETLGSIASWMIIDTRKEAAVGLEINCNHIKSIRTGIVIGTARPIHIGRRTHIWDIRIIDESDNLICIARLTVAIIQNNNFTA